MTAFTQAERAHAAAAESRMELAYTRGDIAEQEYCAQFPKMMKNEELVGEALFERPAALPALLIAIEKIAFDDERSVRHAIGAMKKLREEVAAYVGPIAERIADRYAEDYTGEQF